MVTLAPVDDVSKREINPASCVQAELPDVPQPDASTNCAQEATWISNADRKSRFRLLRAEDSPEVGFGFRASIRVWRIHRDLAFLPLATSERRERRPPE